MGRGLSPEQKEMLVTLANGKTAWGTKSKRVEGCQLRVRNPRWCFLDDPSPEDVRAYNVACASQSRTLRRLKARGLVERVKLQHWYRRQKRLGDVIIWRLTPQGEQIAMQITGNKETCSEAGDF